MQVVDVLKAVVQIGSQLKDVVVMVEGMVPAGTKGTDKLAMVESIIERSLTAVGQAATVFQLAWPILAPLVEMIVKRMNEDGTFVHATH